MEGTVREEGEDACKSIMERYRKSRASQHHHLCAAAAAMKSILLQENLPLTRSAYFAATITALKSKVTTYDDPPAVAALSTLLSILLPLLPPQSLSSPKAFEAIAVLVDLLRVPGGLSNATNRSVVKSIGFLFESCDISDWVPVKSSFWTILHFSIDRRPKVRKCAQTCLEKAFMSFHSPIVTKKASKMVLSLFESYMPLAIELSTTRTVNGSNRDAVAKPEHLEVLHMLNALKLIIPFLSKKATSKCTTYLCELLGCQFSCLTRHILNVLEGFFEVSRAEIFVSEAEIVIVSLSSYVSTANKNPKDTLMFAITLLKTGLDKLHAVEPSICIINLPLVFSSVAGILNIDADAATHAADILKGLINCHIDLSIFQGSENQFPDGQNKSAPELNAMKSICTVLENLLCSCGGVPDVQILSVISDLFHKLGETSYFFLKSIVIKLSELEMLLDKDTSVKTHVHACIGSAIVAMGPEMILSVVPLSLDAEKLTCSNIWLIPILKKFVIGASLGFFMEHIVPLAKSLHSARRKVKESSLVQELQTCSHGLWDLLPSFCNYPIDTASNFKNLSKLLIDVLKEDCTMHETITLALLRLVNQNKDILRDIGDANDGFIIHSTASMKEDCQVEARRIPSCYSKKTASRNIQALASNSMDLLVVLVDVFFDSPPEKRAYFKEAIGCIASITKGLKVKNLFISLVEKCGKFRNKIHASVDEEQDQSIEKKQIQARKCLLIELAFSLVEGADVDGINIIFDYIKPALQADDEIGQLEAYRTLSNIFKVHPWFYSVRFEELIDFLLTQKPPVDAMSQRSRFACLHFLLVHLLKNELDNMSARALLILNEIITTLKDTKQDARRSAYDVLLMTSSSLMDTLGANSGAPLQRLFDMIIGCLAGTHPHLMSGAVAALSLLIYKNTEFCFTVPNLLPSVLALLHSKAREVIKAVLGFIKVLVTCLQAEDLNKLLPDIVNGILPWSSVSKHHFKSKVRLILEILIRKCSPTSVESVMQEKYRGLVKTIFDQRHGKPSWRQGGDSSNASLKKEDSLVPRGKKRTHEELMTPKERRDCSQVFVVTGKGKRRKKVSKTANNDDKIRWQKKAGHSLKKRFGGRRKNKKGKQVDRKPRSGDKDMKMRQGKGNMGSTTTATRARPKSRFGASLNKKDGKPY